jgi:molybdenum cofactor cytidylyltransferase
MVEGIVLAAGSSARAGTFKMMMPLGTKKVLEHAVQGMNNVCSRIIVVAGFQIEQVRDLMVAYGKVEVVENAAYKSGMLSSIKAGVRNLAGERFFVLPGDIPLVPASVYTSLLLDQSDIVVPTFEGKKGHPVLLNSSLAEEILKEPDASSLGRFVQRKGCSTLEVDEEAILWDVDTIPELLGLQRKLK